ncbi:hypothetical protein Tco_1130076 [Tanacetum coccineum]
MDFYLYTNDQISLYCFQAFHYDVIMGQINIPGTHIPLRHNFGGVTDKASDVVKDKADVVKDKPTNVVKDKADVVKASVAKDKDKAGVVKDKPTNVVKDKVDVVKAPVAKEKEKSDVVKDSHVFLF